MTSGMKIGLMKLTESPSRIPLHIGQFSMALTINGTVFALLGDMMHDCYKCRFFNQGAHKPMAGWCEDRCFWKPRLTPAGYTQYRSWRTKNADGLCEDFEPAVVFSCPNCGYVWDQDCLTFHEYRCEGCWSRFIDPKPTMRLSR